MYLFETQNGRHTIGFSVLVLMWTIFIHSTVSIAANTISVKPENATAGGTSIYHLEFQLDQPLSPQATIIVSFPAGFHLNGVLIAGSATINGGFRVKVNNLDVEIQRSGLGRTIRAGEKVDLRFANVVNPEATDRNYEVRVRIRDNNTVIANKISNVQIAKKEIER